MDSRPADGLGTLLRRLIELLDGDLERLYSEDVGHYRPRYTPVMKALKDGRPRTIKEIAAASSVSQPAASQTVSQMAAEGLVSQAVGRDARERHVRLTPRGHSLLPALERVWRAAEQVEGELEAEIGVPLRQQLATAVAGLAHAPFYDRLRAAAAAQPRSRRSHP